MAADPSAISNYLPLDTMIQWFFDDVVGLPNSLLEDVTYLYGALSTSPNFLRGPTKTNSCPYGTNHVLDLTQCKSAYNELVLTIDIQSSDIPYTYDLGAGYPSGCQITDPNTVEFNTNTSPDTTGRTHNMYPICTPVKYIYGPLNTSTCPEGTSHVTDSTQCYEAYTQLSKTDSKLVVPEQKYIYATNYGPERPTGCQVNRKSQAIELNTNGPGGTYPVNIQPICINPLSKFNKVPVKTAVPRPDCGCPGWDYKTDSQTGSSYCTQGRVHCHNSWPSSHTYCHKCS